MNSTEELIKNTGQVRRWSFFENASVFLTGAVIYYLAELIYRGYSHITMFFAGGLCFFLIYNCEKRMAHMKKVLRCVIYAFMITAVELIFGVVFNIIFDMGIWDYSEQPFNILGQVCPGFVLVWMALSFPAILLSAKIRQLFVKLLKKSADRSL